jgi:hypothetical protein
LLISNLNKMVSIKKILLPLLLIVLVIPQLKSQTIEWEKNFGGSDNDYLFFNQQTDDGGFIAVGSTESTDGDISENAGFMDYWIIKINQNGEMEWEKNLGGTDSESARYVEQTSDGGYILCGNSKSNDGDVGGNNGDSDYWVVKLDEDGEIMWEKNYGGSSNDFAWSIKQTTDEGDIVSGYSGSSDGDVSGNNGSTDYWILKLDVDGEIVWDKNLGGSSNETARYIQQSEDGGFVVAGFSRSNDGDVGGNNGGFDYWIVKLNSDGEIMWEKSLGGSNDEIGWSVEELITGGYIVCGYSNSNDGDVGGNNGGSDYWIVGLGSDGEILWEKNYGGSNNEFTNSLQQTIDGGYIIGGNSGSLNSGDVGGNNGGSDYWIVKVNQTGEILWEKNLGGTGTEGLWWVQQTIDEGYIIAGFSESNDGDVGGNNGMADYWIVKLAPLTSSTTTLANDKGGISIQPNPNKGIFFIESNILGSSFEVEIYNSSGKIVYTQSGNSKQLNLQGISKGIYTLVVVCDSVTYSKLLLLQ